MNLLATYEIPQNVLLQQIDNETLLLNTTSLEFFSLNEMGLQIWTDLPNYSNLDSLIKDYSKVYIDLESGVAIDIKNFILVLEEKELIIFHD